MVAEAPRAPPIRCYGSRHVTVAGRGHAHGLLGHIIPIVILGGGEAVWRLALHHGLARDIWVSPTWGRRHGHVQPIRRRRRASHIGYLRGRRGDGVAVDALVRGLHLDWLAGDHWLRTVRGVAPGARGGVHWFVPVNGGVAPGSCVARGVRVVFRVPGERAGTGAGVARAGVVGLIAERILVLTVISVVLL